MNRMKKLGMYILACLLVLGVITPAQAETALTWDVKGTGTNPYTLTFTGEGVVNLESETALVFEEGVTGQDIDIAKTPIVTFTAETAPVVKIVSANQTKTVLIEFGREVKEEPTPKEPVTEEPPAEEPVTEEPPAEEPIKEDPPAKPVKKSQLKKNRLKKNRSRKNRSRKNQNRRRNNRSRRQERSAERSGTMKTKTESVKTKKRASVMCRSTSWTGTMTLSTKPIQKTVFIRSKT